MLCLYLPRAASSGVGSRQPSTRVARGHAFRQIAFRYRSSPHTSRPYQSSFLRLPRGRAIKSRRRKTGYWSPLAANNAPLMPVAVSTTAKRPRQATTTTSAACTRRGRQADDTHTSGRSYPRMRMRTPATSGDRDQLVTSCCRKRIAECREMRRHAACVNEWRLFRTRYLVRLLFMRLGPLVNTFTCS